MQFRFPRLTPTVKKLVIFLGVTFVLTSVIEVLAGVPIYRNLALDLRFLQADTGWIRLLWQPFTYWLIEPAVPESLFGLALNLVVIYFFLSPFEESFGPRRTLHLAGIGVVAGAAGAFVLAALWSLLANDLVAFAPVHGAAVIGAAAFGAFPVIFRGREIILFPLMIPLKAWTALAIGVALSTLMAILARNPMIFATYASAIGAGVAFARWMTRPRPPKKKKPERKRRGGPDLTVVRGGEDRPRWLN